MTIISILSEQRAAPCPGPPLLSPPGPGKKNQVKLANTLGSAVCPLAELPVPKDGKLSVGVCHLHGSQAEEWDLLEVRETPRPVQSCSLPRWSTSPLCALISPTLKWH